MNCPYRVFHVVKSIWELDLLIFLRTGWKSTNLYFLFLCTKHKIIYQDRYFRLESKFPGPSDVLSNYPASFICLALQRNQLKALLLNLKMQSLFSIRPFISAERMSDLPGVILGRDSSRLAAGAAASHKSAASDIEYMFYV